MLLIVKVIVIVIRVVSPVLVLIVQILLLNSKLSRYEGLSLVFKRELLLLILSWLLKIYARCAIHVGPLHEIVVIIRMFKIILCSE